MIVGYTEILVTTSSSSTLNVMRSPANHQEINGSPCAIALGIKTCGSGSLCNVGCGALGSGCGNSPKTSAVASCNNFACISVQQF